MLILELLAIPFVVGALAWVMENLGRWIVRQRTAFVQSAVRRTERTWILRSPPPETAERTAGR